MNGRAARVRFLGEDNEMPINVKKLIELSRTASRIQSEYALAITDVACFPYIDTAPEAQVPLEPYTAVRA